MGETLALAAAVFAATDIDDLALLVAFFASPAFRARDVVIGQFAGIAALYGASVALALAALALPAGYLPYLGILPLVLGVRERLEKTDEAPPARPRRATLAAVAGTTIAGGGDNVAAYVPLLAGRPGWEMAAFGAVFACLTALWCLLAWRLVRHPAAARALGRYGRPVSGLVLIGLGLLVLARLLD